MAVMALAAIGAGIGSMIGGTFLGMSAASLGWSLGSMAGNMLFGGQDIRQEGPRLGDLKVIASTYGNSIPRLYGAMRVSGNVIWSSDIIETRHEESIDGKGGPSVTAISYTYSQSMAVALCEGEIAGIRKIWANGKLIYNRSDDADLTTLIASDADAASITVYPGSETQTADATIELYVGAGQAPAYRGTAYVVFADLQLADYGNRMPNLEFEVLRAGTGSNRVITQSATTPGTPTAWAHGSGLTGQLSAPDGSTSPVAGYRWNFSAETIPRYNGGLHDGPASFSWTGCGLTHATGGYTERLQTQLVAFLTGQAPATVTTTTNIASTPTTPSGTVLTLDIDASLAKWAIGPGPSIVYTNPAVSDLELVAYYKGANLPAITNINIDPYYNVVTRRRYNYASALLETKVSQFLDANESPRWWQAVSNGGAIHWMMEGCYTSATSACFILNQEGVLVGDFLLSDYGFTAAMPSATYYSVATGLVYAAISPGVLIVHASSGAVISAVPGAVCPVAVDESGYLYSFDTATGISLKMDSALNVLATYTMTNNASLVYTQLCGRDGNDWYFGNTLSVGSPAAWKITTTTTTIDAATRDTGTMSGTADTFVYLGGGAVMSVSGSQIVVFGVLGATATTLASIVSDICLTGTGLVAGDIDVTNLSGNVHGYVTQRGAARGKLQPLMKAFYFDAVESNGKIKFVTRGAASAASIAEDDLAAHEYGGTAPDPLDKRRAHDMELPVEVAVQYLDTGAAYQIGAQTSRRQVVHSENKTSLNLAIALSATQAKKVADVVMYDAWTGRTRFDFVTGWKYAHLEPTDIITLTADGRSYVIRLVEENASGGIYQRSAVLEDASVYTQTATAAELTVPGAGVAGIPQTNLRLMDIPLLRDQDDGIGFYAAAAGYDSGWLGAQIYKSTDAGASWASYGAGILNEAAIGWANTALGDFTQNIVDESNSVSVILSSGELSSDTLLNVLNGANVALLGDEIIQFRDATLTATDTYTLTGLLRGRLGTEWARSTHSIGDRFVVLSASTTHLLIGSSGEYDIERLYRGVTLGGFVDDADDVFFTHTAVALMPYSPVHLGGGRNVALDATLSWVRRSRIGGAWNAYADVPLGEASESYEVDICSNSGYTTVVRTITGITGETTSYTAAQQTTDFGSTQATLYFIVYQVSAVVGRGYGARGVI